MGDVVIAYDGDEAGQKALETVMLNTLDGDENEKNYIRNLIFNDMPMAQAVRSLTNWEIADELSSWNHMRKVRGAPDWWYEMCEDAYGICQRDITRRSTKIKDYGGFDYITVYNDNNAITDVLAEYGIMTNAGKTVRCPMHDDSTPSLSVTPNNRRAYCFNQACILYGNGHGEDAFELNKILSR